MDYIACQAPLSMGFSRQEYWSGLPFPPPGDLLTPGTEPRSPALQADSLPSESPRKLPIWHWLQSIRLDAGCGHPLELVGVEWLHVCPGDEQVASIKSSILEGNHLSTTEHNKDYFLEQTLNKYSNED